ncbi:hypothetical protein FACS1894132_07710 [Clostridia bacterium]|nr:hypothetical protein FACS1894132_07710 [Clostridia bacterium]
MTIEIANRLVMLRKQNNLSQDDLAEKLGISRQAVSKWERAESSPDTDNIIRLAKLYNVSLDNLLSCEELPPLDEPPFEEPIKETSIEEPIVEKPATEEIPIEKENSVNEENAELPTNLAITAETPPTPISANSDNEHWLKKFPYPLLVTFVYLVFGFGFNAWTPWFLLWFTIPFYYNYVGILSQKDEAQSENIGEIKRWLKKFPYPIFVTIVYLLFGISNGIWHPTWIIWLTVPLYYSFISALEQKKKQPKSNKKPKTWIMKVYFILAAVICFLVAFGILYVLFNRYGDNYYY